jgi:hypothetical protein
MFFLKIYRFFPKSKKPPLASWLADWLASWFAGNWIIVVSKNG